MLSHTLPSIEEFAAFLDGNLSRNEMQQFSEIAADNDALRQLLDANSIIDETLSNVQKITSAENLRSRASDEIVPFREFIIKDDTSALL